MNIASPSSNTKYLFGVVLVVAIAGTIGAVLSFTAQSGDELEPVPSITHEFPQNHLHGLAYVPEAKGLYLATHYGLFLLRDDQLYQVGDSRDDYMGFSRHPADPDVFLASGHPQTGGNLGVLISQDAGVTWQRIFSGLDGERVDFHSMVVSPADPDRLYGVYQGIIHVGDIAADEWSAAIADGLSVQGYCWGTPCLAIAPDDADRLYAATAEGIHVSEDGGDNWNRLSDDTGAAAGIAAHPEDPDLLIAHTEAYGIAISRDGGLTWEMRHRELVPTGDLIFGFAFDPGTPDRVFAASMHGRVFESTDLGRTWQPIPVLE